MYSRKPTTRFFLGLGLAGCLAAMAPGAPALAKSVRAPPGDRTTSSAPAVGRPDDMLADATPSIDPPAETLPDLPLMSEPPSGTAGQLAGWISAARDNGALPFLIVDKLGAEVFAFEPGGRDVAVRLARQLGVETRPLPGGSNPRHLLVIVGPQRGPGL